MNETGWIYIIQSGPYHKIGKTMKLQQRLTKYRHSEAPFKQFNCVASRLVPNYHRVEKHMHMMCKSYPPRFQYPVEKVNNEWFRIPRRKVHRLVKYLYSVH